MKIHNIRFGHACNSSSTHSVVWMGDQELVTDEKDHFGWGYFTAADEESRRNYAMALVAANVRLDIPWNYPGRKEAEAAILRSLLGQEPTDAQVDHQSVIRFPHAGNMVNPEFVREFVEWFATAPIAVLGGNDNDDEVHPAAALTEPVDFIDRFTGIARKDPTYDFWTVFNPVSGTKVRFSFKDRQTPTRASLPELVDLKITDFCPFDCAFCLDPSTQVLQTDLTWVAIGDLNAGDEVLGFDESAERKQRKLRRSRVEGVLHRRSSAIAVGTDKGELTVSPEHKFLDKHGRWREARNFRLGQEASLQQLRARPEGVQPRTR